MSAHNVDGRIVSVNLAGAKGVRKDAVESIKLVVDHGVEGDAHAGPWHRQVSLLANESIGKMLAACPGVDPGAFGENVTTEGLVLYELPVGARFYAGESLLEVTQIGKECHSRCAIFHQAGDCVMPREGIFAKVIEGGELRPGEGIVLLKNTLIHAAVLTVSDKGSRGEREDTSGDALEKALRELGAAAVERAIVPDEADQIAAELRRWADETPVNLVLTTGGTGMTSRDVTPEATLSVLERQAPGFTEAMRAGSLVATPHAMLSRAVGGIRGRTLIVNMPGSPRACSEQFAMIAAALPHGVEKLLDLGGDCAAPLSPAGGSERGASSAAERLAALVAQIGRNGCVGLLHRPAVAGREAVADALARDAESLGHGALVAELPVRRDRLPLFVGAGADERIDEPAEGAEQYVAGVPRAEVAGQAVVAYHQLQGPAGDRVGVAVGRRGGARVVHRADSDADAGAQLERGDELAKHTEAQWRLRRVRERAVQAADAGQAEGLRHRRPEHLVDAL